MREADNEESSYHVEERDDLFKVLSPSGVTIMDCRDRHSADHYAVLLTEAYRIGFRAGFRAGKRTD
jgi:hypothetical protein